MSLYIKKNIVKVFPKITLALILGGLFLFPSIVSAATLSVNPSLGTFETGERVVVRVIATSNNVPFNAVSALLSFPVSVFSIESVSKTNSVLDFWVTEPSINRSTGTVKFEGISLGGFTGSTGTILTVNLRAIKAGSGRVLFQSGQILANDGEGTDITGNLIGADFSVKEAVPKETPTKTTPPKVVVPKEPVEEEIVQPKPSLSAPEIMLGTKYGAQAILGNSQYPNAQVLVTFVSSTGAKVFILGTAEDDGSFGLLVPNSLKRDTYTATAVMIKEDKTNSETSNMVYVKVGNIFSDITKEIWALIVLLVISILYLLLRTYVHFGKKRKLGARKAEEIVHKSFDLIREDLAGKGKISSAEQKRITGVKSDINEAEKIITKELKDLESNDR